MHITPMSLKEATENIVRSSRDRSWEPCVNDYVEGMLRAYALYVWEEACKAIHGIEVPDNPATRQIIKFRDAFLTKLEEE